ERLGELAADEAGQHIGRSARREWHDDAHGLVGVSLRECLAEMAADCGKPDRKHQVQKFQCGSLCSAATKAVYGDLPLMPRLAAIRRRDRTLPPLSGLLSAVPFSHRRVILVAFFVSVFRHAD